MHSKNYASLVVFLYACLPVCVLADEPVLKFFRSDSGVVASSTRLPEDLNSPGALRWRTALDSGHSTPVVANGRIFLTTFNPTVQELATVALADDSGNQLWKRVARTSKIEAYHKQTGNPADCSPACDGERDKLRFSRFEPHAKKADCRYRPP